MLTMNKGDKVKGQQDDLDPPKNPGPKKQPRPPKAKGGSKGDAGQSSNESGMGW